MFDAPAGVPQDNTDDIASLASHPAAPHPAAGEPVSAATLDAMVGRAAQALKEMQREDELYDLCLVLDWNVSARMRETPSTTVVAWIDTSANEGDAAAVTRTDCVPGFRNVA